VGERTRALQAALIAAKEANEAKSDFLARVSHDLRTPLTSIMGYLELFVRRTLGPLSETQLEAIKVMARNAETLTRHVNNLLYLQEARSVKLKRVTCELHVLLRNILEEVGGRAHELAIELSVDIHPTAPFLGDMLGLDQVIRNLLDNAFKFTPRRGQVRVSLHDEPTRVILRVEDTGIGIPAEAQEKIFLPFYQVDSSLARQHPGAGMGLAIVKHVVEAHGGQVIVRSAPGQGSTFTLVLPRT
jgi:signal transduction histidine kinase